MHKMYVGIDNGVTGTIGFLNADDGVGTLVYTPTKLEQSYTKKRQSITRIDYSTLAYMLGQLREQNPFVVMERPMVDPKRFTASVSALRALEATLIVIEVLNIPYRYCDSKGWQKMLLPKGTKGEALKSVGKQIAGRCWPDLDLSKFKDADGLLIAEWARRMGF